MSLVRRTATASLIVQGLAGIATVVTFFVPGPEDYVYTDEVRLIVGIEGVSQLIEFMYYLVAVVWFGGNISTWTRYIDWYLSTPVMLISTALFFVHRSQSGRDLVRTLDVREEPNLYLALSLNALMLSFGLAMELEALSRVVGIGFGTLALSASFSFLARYVDDDDVMSTSLFWIMFGVWLLYGVAAAFSYVPRNTMYNILDIVSKNFYGVFLFVYLMTR